MLKKKIIEIEHPDYSRAIPDYIKWRLAYDAGDLFINTYLKKFSVRESDDDFKTRKQMTYLPAFATAAINDIKNAIYQRTTDIARVGGSQSYEDAVAGENFGVDLLGSSMNSFVGRKLLPELLVMGKVGVFVDMPEIGPDASMAESNGKHPYVYYYRAEDIPCWSWDETDNPSEFQSILLRDWVFLYDEDSNLPYEQVYRYRHLWKEDGIVYVQFYDEAGSKCDKFGNKDFPDPVALNIPTIPFVILTISNSLMSYVANYQIAHLNIASSDIMWILKANFPFYVEEYDPLSELAYIRPPGEDNPGQAATAQAANAQEVKVGITQGRRYPKGMNAPSFIHPSSEPLTVSMAKQETIKAEIRQLVNLAVSQLQPKMASADSKAYDERGLEAGLSYIGLELEHAERQIARYWGLYENKTPATVIYPKNYSLKTEADRQNEAKALQAQMETVPSITYKRNMAKQIAYIALGSKVSSEDLAKIYAEIDKAPAIVGSAETITSDVQNGLVSLETASTIRGYPKGEAEKAKTDHADRLARIAASQTSGARGVGDLSGQPTQDAATEKAASRETITSESTAPKVRGKGK